MTPHSCGEQCIRPRTCEHPCSLYVLTCVDHFFSLIPQFLFLRPCHPGPCPPCILSVERSCHCGQEVIVSRCSRIHEAPNPALSCGRVCSKPLACGKHVCMQTCHPGECPGCEESDLVSCYCGKETKSVPCGDGLVKHSAVIVNGEKKEWDGRYECEDPCGQTYACGVHSCESVSCVFSDPSHFRTDPFSSPELPPTLS